MTLRIDLSDWLPSGGWAGNFFSMSGKEHLPGPEGDEFDDEEAADYGEIEEDLGGIMRFERPEQGMRVMAALAGRLEEEMRRLSEAAEKFPEHSEKYAGMMGEKRRRLQEARGRYAEYKALAEGRN